MPGIRDFTQLVVNKLTNIAFKLFFVSKQEDKHQQRGDLSFVQIRFFFGTKIPLTPWLIDYCHLQCGPETAKLNDRQTIDPKTPNATLRACNSTPRKLTYI